jgi:hypothetical protein
MTVPPYRSWFGLAPLALLLALLLGAAAPAGHGTAERGVGPGLRLAGVGGARVARPGAASQALLEVARGHAAASAHGAPAALFVRIAAFDAARAASPRPDAAPARVLPSRLRTYDPRGPPQVA